jgi:hypothetical protein
MGEQSQPERKIEELCTPDIIDLPILNLAEIGRPFEIKTSTIHMVQHSPFTGKEDPNLHLQAFIQLCQTFNMDGVTQDQMRARLFPFSLLGKALQWFYSQPTEMVQNWDTLMRAFMKEYYSRVKLKAYTIRLLLLLNIIWRLYRRHSSASMSTSGGSTSQVLEGGSHSKVLPRTYHGVKGDHRCIGGRIHHQAYADPRFHSIKEGRGQ